MKFLFATLACWFCYLVFAGATPVITDVFVDQIGPHYATLHGKFNRSGDKTVTVAAVYVWSDADASPGDQFVTPGFHLPARAANDYGIKYYNESGGIFGVVGSIVYYLHPGTVYHYRFAIDDHGTPVTSEGSFTTLAQPPFLELETTGAPVTVDPLGDELALDHGGTLAFTPMINVFPNGYGVKTTVSGTALTLSPTSDFAGHAFVEYGYLGYPQDSTDFNFIVLRAPDAMRQVRFLENSTADLLGEGVTFKHFQTPELAIFRATVSKGQTILYSIGAGILHLGNSVPDRGAAVIIGIVASSGPAALVDFKNGEDRSRWLLSDLDKAKALIGDHAGSDPALIGELVGKEGARVLFAPGSVIRKIEEFDGDGTVFFRATLSGPNIDSRNDVAVLTKGHFGVGGFVNGYVLRTGGEIAKITTLVAAPGSSAQSRWRVSMDTFGARLTYSNGTEGLVVAGMDQPLAMTGMQTGHPEIGRILRFGLPGFGGDASASGVFGVNIGAVVRAVVQNSSGPGEMILNFAPGSVRVLAALNSAPKDAQGLPMSKVKFSHFDEPVAGSMGLKEGPEIRAAFTARLTGSAINSRNDTGLWFAADGITAKLLARKGDLAPGGGVWSRFTSLVLPKVVAPSANVNPAVISTMLALSAPRFVAKLLMGVDGVTPANDRGIWGVDSTGKLQLMLRTGQSIDVNGTPKIVRSFRALETAPHSHGAAHGYDGDGKVAAVVTFADGQEALVQLALP